MNNNKNSTFIAAIPTLKEALRSVGFKEIAANVYTIPKKKEYKVKESLSYA